MPNTVLVIFFLRNAQYHKLLVPTSVDLPLLRRLVAAQRQQCCSGCMSDSPVTDDPSSQTHFPSLHNQQGRKSHVEGVWEDEGM